MVGAGPCGLRMAIESALLGAKVVIIEMRDYISRNNVLHLWPFVIQDMIAIGAKEFYPKFASGNLNHVSKLLVASLLSYQSLQFVNHVLKITIAYLTRKQEAFFPSMLKESACYNSVLSYT